MQNMNGTMTRKRTSSRTQHDDDVAWSANKYVADEHRKDTAEQSQKQNTPNELVPNRISTIVDDIFGSISQLDSGLWNLNVNDAVKTGQWQNVGIHLRNRQCEINIGRRDGNMLTAWMRQHLGDKE